MALELVRGDEMPASWDPERSKSIAEWADGERQRARTKYAKFYQQATKAWRYYLYADGKVDRANKFDSLVKTNPLRDAIEKMVAVGTDSRPNLMVYPRQPEDAYLARAMNDVIAWVWDTQVVDQIVEDYLREHLVTGLSWLFTGWDAAKKDVLIWKPDCRDVTWDPDARVIAKRRWVGVESYIPRSTAVAMWPDAYEEIMKIPGERPSEDRSDFDNDFSSQGTAPTVSPAWESSFRYAGSSPGIKMRMGMDRAGVRPDDNTDTLHYFEMYIRPTATEWGSGPGRKICVLGHSIIPPDGDIESPFDDVERHPDPFVELSMDEVPGESGPQGILKQGISLQKQRGELIRDICNHAKRESSTRHFYNKAYVKKEDLTSGEVWIPTDVDGLDENWVKSVQAAQMSDAVISAYRIVVDEFDVTMGIHDPDRGEVTGESAGVVLKEAKKVFQQGVRLRVRGLERSLDQVGNRLCSRIRQFYTYPKTIRILGQDGMAFMSLTPVPMNAGGEIAQMSPFSLAQDEFDFKVKTGSSMPPDIEKTIQIGMVMAQNGWINPTQVVQYTPFSPDGPALQPQPMGVMPGGAPVNPGTMGQNSNLPAPAPSGTVPMSGTVNEAAPAV